MVMYKWIIEKFYGDSMVSTSKDGFKTYNQCLEDVLRHTTIDIAFRSAYEAEITNLIIKIEKVESDEQMYDKCSDCEYTNYDNYVQKVENQQKEFINYLEDESKEIYRDGGLRQNIFKQVLQKYKSIIGENDEKK